ncbi:GAF domain-containing protein [Sphingomonas sp. LY160]|uniref:GAF domain-containing protein n=1 Tax=Sphingomonas sp. LY160 TaxID=3095342 RepID=UPI002ADEB1D8|nr:GAF domain-containing protein [Sphingomonas sp. LY160]MEA1073071.1 GAF domain-containing protein [Sphingomonas sp. LY160]
MGDKLSHTIAEWGDDPDIRAALAEVCELTGMGFSAVAFVSEDRWIACQVDDRIEFGMDPGGELEIKKTICTDVRQCGEAIVIDDTSEDPDWWNHPVPILYGFKSYLSIPLNLDDGTFFGTLCAIDPRPRDVPLKKRLPDLESVAQKVARLLSEKTGNRGAT